MSSKACGQSRVETVGKKEMNLKMALFSVLSSLFVFYSLFVYTIGTGLHENLAQAGPSVSRGKELWQNHNCTACHQLYGLGGYLGPDLTMVVPKRGGAYAKAFILSGTERMPNFHLTEEESQALVDYLSYISSTAVTYQTDAIAKE
jgi:nitric oxide reductase subunit C